MTRLAIPCESLACETIRDTHAEAGVPFETRCMHICNQETSRKRLHAHAVMQQSASYRCLHSEDYRMPHWLACIIRSICYHFPQPSQCYESVYSFVVSNALINGMPHPYPPPPPPPLLGLGGGEVGDCHIYDVVTPTYGASVGHTLPHLSPSYPPSFHRYSCRHSYF